MKRICKGSYGNLDSLNTECLKLTEIYQKVHTLECNWYSAFLSME